MRSAHLGRDLRSAAPPFSCRDPFFPVLSKLDLSAWHGRHLIISPKRSQKWTAADIADTEQFWSGYFFFFFFFFPFSRNLGGDELHRRTVRQQRDPVQRDILVIQRGAEDPTLSTLPF